MFEDMKKFARDRARADCKLCAGEGVRIEADTGSDYYCACTAAQPAKQHGFNYDQLDPGIRETVRRLHSWGFVTTDSGDGITKATTECARCTLNGFDGCSECGWRGTIDTRQERVPHVHMRITSDVPERWAAEAFRLRECLTRHGIDYTAEGVMVQLTWSPDDSIALLSLYGVSDASWPEVAS